MVAVSRDNRLLNAGGGRAITPRQVDLLVVSAIAAAAIVVTVVLTNPGLERPGLAIVLGLAGLGVPVATAVFAMRHGSAPRFAWLLVALGFAWGFATLSNSSSELLFSVGRITAWGTLVLTIFVLLAYPTGRLQLRRDTVIVVTATLVVAALYLPFVLLDLEFPNPSPWGTCTDSCPANAFAVVEDEPGFMGAIVTLRELLALSLFLAAAVSIAARARAATPARRRALMPVAVVAVATLVLDSVFIVLRGLDAPEATLVVTAAGAATVAPLISVGFLVGLLRWRLHTARALERLSLDAGSPMDPGELERDLAAAIGDPGLRLLVAPQEGLGWTDSVGRPVARPVPGPSTVEVADADGRVSAVLVCEPDIAAQPGLRGALAGLIQGLQERWRLTRALDASLNEVAESRARLAATADAERRRIERDLHDGAQQRLIALRVRLALLEETMADGQAPIMHGLGDEVDQAIDEVRSLSRGIYPALLVDGGPAEALRAAASGSPLQVDVSAPDLHRHQPEVESAVYFCCLEAIQNALKHADGASRVSVGISDSAESVEFRVRDDGCGFDPAASSQGQGLLNIRDRVAALGGTVEILGRPGRGTLVSGSIPFTAPFVRSPVAAPS